MMTSPFEGLISDSDITRLAAQEGLCFDKERQDILKAMHSIDVQACPGSGKTTLIASKLILLAQKWPFKHQGVCVLSHTNVAKDEIVDRLKCSQTTDARSLLSYPHFIGTIQEFVNKFLGIPFARSRGININHIDTEFCVELIRARLQYKTRAYIDRKSLHSNVLYDFNLRIENYDLEMDIPTFPNGSDSNSYKDLRRTRCSLIKQGFLFYRDSYVFAEKLLIDNQSVAAIISQRFPYVLMDEMQDTQAFQDDLLRKVFPLVSQASSVQRFGDPDQAIFNGINGEEPNKSYIGKLKNEMDFVIDQSHRFDNSIASLIKGLSFNGVPLTSEPTDETLDEDNDRRASDGQFDHTIFIYGEGGESRVIPAFARHVSAQFADDYKRSEKFSVKVIGAVGNEIDRDGQLKIGHYWPSFIKNKTKNSFKELTLQEAVIHCRAITDVNWLGRYKLLHNCFLRILRMADKKDTNGNYFNATSMKEFLKGKGKWHNLRLLFFYLINSRITLDEKSWEKAVAVIQKVFEIDALSKELETYLAYLDKSQTSMPDEAVEEHGELRPIDTNTISHRDGFRIELSTIHGVKGETHDATLVLETKNYCRDLGVMLPYLTGELPDRNNANADLKENPSTGRKPNQKFMRQLYVAMSRPRHLLCMAMRKQALGTGDEYDANVTKLESLGWHIHEIAGAE